METTREPTRRELLADAAITTLARSGLRGLTHRAVDQEAGLAEGSCSYYFRTRQALLQATVDRLVQVDAEQLMAGPVLVGADDLDAAVHSVAEVVVAWTTTGRDRMLARYELSLEGTRRPELRKALREAGRQPRLLARDLLKAAGVSEPDRRAGVFAAFLDGLVFDQVAGAGALELDVEDVSSAVAELLRGYGLELRN